MVRSCAVTHRMIIKLRTSHLGKGERCFSALNKAKLKLSMTASLLLASYEKSQFSRHYLGKTM